MNKNQLSMNNKRQKYEQGLMINQEWKKINDQWRMKKDQWSLKNDEEWTKSID